MGNPDTGNPWVPLAGVWGIAGNQAHCVTASGTNDSAVVETNVANCTVQAAIPVITAGASVGLVVRAVDTDNMFFTNTGSLFRRLAGVQTNAGSVFTQTFVGGDTIRIVCSEYNITTYRQAASTGAFVQVGAYADSTMATATKHGIRSSATSGTTSRFNDFSVQP